MSLEVFYQNVRGLKSKTKSFYLNVLQQHNDLLLLSETWLNNTVYNSELFDSRYKIYRKDRDFKQKGKKDGGGVLMAVSKRLFSEQLKNLENDDEYIVVKIRSSSKNNQNIIICLAYFPPKTNSETYKKFFNMIFTFLQSSNDRLLIVGDFNIKDITWKDDQVAITPINWSGDEADTLIPSYLKCNLTQTNNIRNKDGNLLDLVFTNTPDNVSVKETDPISRIDLYHPPIIIKISDVSLSLSRPNFPKKRKFNSENIDKTSREISKVVWDDLHDLSDPSIMASLFTTRIRDCIDNNIPLKTSKSKFPIWFNKELIILLKLKDKHRRIFKKHNNLHHFNLFKNFREAVKIKIKDCYNDYINHTEKEIKNNLKQFWSFINNKKRNHGYPNTMNFNNKILTDPVDLANGFKDHFSSIFEANSSNPFNNYNHSKNSNPLIPYILVDETKAIIKNLKPSYSSGPDNIPSIIIKSCVNSIAYPLTLIFNTSLNLGEFPKCWKIANLVPIHKSGSKMI